jgi:membrane protease YdiL (CAAX protease family)
MTTPFVAIPGEDTAPVGTPAGDRAGISIPQYSRGQVLAVWAAATVPMALLAWVVAPLLAGRHADGLRFSTTLIWCLTAGLAWQALLVALVVRREQGTLRWAVLREALWLVPPSAPDGRRGGRLWLWLVPFTLGFGLLQLVPVNFPEPARRSMGAFLGSDAGQHWLHHNWGALALLVLLLVLNTVIGEELLFRGLLLPRMAGAFGRADWLANAALFGLYHLHMPWGMPADLLAGGLFAYSTRRWRSAWLGIAAHSAQSVFFLVLFLLVALR